MGRRRGRRGRNKRNNNYENQQQNPNGKKARKKERQEKLRSRKTMEDHVIGIAQDQAETLREKRTRTLKIKPEVPIELTDETASSCSHKLVVCR